MESAQESVVPIGLSDGSDYEIEEDKDVKLFGI